MAVQSFLLTVKSREPALNMCFEGPSAQHHQIVFTVTRKCLREAQSVNLVS